MQLHANEMSSRIHIRYWEYLLKSSRRRCACVGKFHDLETESNATSIATLRAADVVRRGEPCSANHVKPNVADRERYVTAAQFRCDSDGIALHVILRGFARLQPRATSTGREFVLWNCPICRDLTTSEYLHNLDR